MKLAVPDLISNSYFPAVAAVELGCFEAEGLDVSLELVFPVDRAYQALSAGEIDFVAGSAHSAVAAFPEWRGVKLLCAQSQGMYWFLVMRSDLASDRGDLSVIRGKTIGAAPWVDLGLRALLAASGIDLNRDAVTIMPVPGATGSNVNFGLTAAKALAERKIDGFWANGMGTEVAVRAGAGRVVLDVRRGDGPPESFNYTMPTVAVADRMIHQDPATAAAAVRAIVRAQNLLIDKPALAFDVGMKVFPPNEAKLIEALVVRDIPYYKAEISHEFVSGMNRFLRGVGKLTTDPAYEDVVATQFSDLWNV